MEQNLGTDIKIIRTLNAVAAGTTNQNGGDIDTQGFDGVLFVAALGALTATQTTSLKAQQSPTGGGSGYNDLAGSGTGNMADGDSNKMLAIDVYRPAKRYVRCVVVRGTANAVIDGVIAILYRGLKNPLPSALQDTTVSKALKALASPAEGTP